MGKSIIGAVVLAGLGGVLAGEAEARCRGLLCAFARGAAESAGKHAIDRVLGGRPAPAAPPAPPPYRPASVCRVVVVGPCGYDAVGRYGCIRREICSAAVGCR